MKCPECDQAGLVSKVYQRGGVSTAMGSETFWDENGVSHVHDLNTMTWHYECSQGHKWEKSHQRICPAENCEFNARLKAACGSDET